MESSGRQTHHYSFGGVDFESDSGRFQHDRPAWSQDIFWMQRKVKFVKEFEVAKLPPLKLASSFSPWLRLFQGLPSSWGAFVLQPVSIELSRQSFDLKTRIDGRTSWLEDEQGQGIGLRIGMCSPRLGYGGQWLKVKSPIGRPVAEASFGIAASRAAREVVHQGRQSQVHQKDLMWCLSTPVSPNFPLNRVGVTVGLTSSTQTVEGQEQRSRDAFGGLRVGARCQHTTSESAYLKSVGVSAGALKQDGYTYEGYVGGAISEHAWKRNGLGLGADASVATSSDDGFAVVHNIFLAGASCEVHAQGFSMMNVISIQSNMADPLPREQFEKCRGYMEYEEAKAEVYEGAVADLGQGHVRKALGKGAVLAACVAGELAFAVGNEKFRECQKICDRAVMEVDPLGGVWRALQPKSSLLIIPSAQLVRRVAGVDKTVRPQTW